ncbi:MAG: hypothetical protein R3E40_09335 [Rhodocyclaceae bacterium]
MECTLDYDSIAKADSMLGSGAVIVMDETTCMVKAAERLSTSTSRSPAAGARPAARAPTGSTVVHRIEHEEGRSGGP